MGAVLVPVNTRFKKIETIDIILCSGAKLVMFETFFLGHDFAVPTDVAAIDVESNFLASGLSFERQVNVTDITDVIYTSVTT
ncbi:hypothetical protein MLPF_3015 [Mycobacterium lepromatosis]|nr:hypothetical protein MLPF_3015 [Mycobacterium lepromatosis]